MNAHLVPLRWYRYAADAENAKARLQASGIVSVVGRSKQQGERGSGDAKDPGLDLWVEGGVIEVSKAILRDHEHPGLLCERCRARSASVHWTRWEGGHQVTRHLCENCCHGVVEWPCLRARPRAKSCIIWDWTELSWL